MSLRNANAAEQTIDDIYAKYTTPQKDDTVADNAGVRLTPACKIDLADRLNADDRYVNAARDLEAMVSGLKDKATDSCGFFRVNGNEEEPVAVAPVKKPNKFRLIVPTKRLSLGSSATTVSSEPSQQVGPPKTTSQEAERPKIKNFSLYDEFTFNSSINKSPTTTLKDINPTKTNALSKRSESANTSSADKPPIVIPSRPVQNINRENTNPLTNTKSPPTVRKKFVFQSANRSKVDETANFSFDDDDKSQAKDQRLAIPLSNRSPAIRMSFEDDVQDDFVAKKSTIVSKSTDVENKSPRKLSQPSTSLIASTSPPRTTDVIPKKRSKFVPQVPRSSTLNSSIATSTVFVPIALPSTNNPVRDATKKNSSQTSTSSSDLKLRNTAERSPKTSQEIPRSRSNVFPNVDLSDEFDDLVNQTVRQSAPTATAKVTTGFEGLAEFTESISNSNELRAPSTVSYL